jgi:tetratricopeptide (TPR) repeat protein
MGAVPDRFETLMQEILENHSKLRPREGDDEADTEARLNSPVQQAIRVMKRVWPLLLIAALALINIFIRAGYVIAAGLSRNPRKKARLLWLHIRRRTRLAGYRRSTQTLEPDWAYAMEAYCAGTLTLYHDYASARFAPVWTLAQYNTMLDHYREFSIAYQKKVPWVRRALAWIAPIFVMLPQTVTLLLLIMILAADTGYAQADPAQADELYNSAAISQNAELWERAIEQYSTGTRQFPEDPRFPLALGNLYFGRGLYRLAYDQYRHAERLVPDNPELLYRLSQTTGAFNDDASATTYLERLVRVDPDNITATGLLGWMYYKVHRLGDGEAFLLGALDRFGPNADFYMTLGTIYSSMFRYEDAATRYRDCIALVEATNDRLFTSIAHYNFSILESRFYHFDEAWKQTTASLAAQNRSSGHLAKGEMYLRTLNFSGVLSEYNTAYELDTSPLSKMSLAQSYQVAGQLEEARFFAEDCLHTIDTSWMMYYGLDPAGYQRDLHEILYKTYQGLAHTEERVLTRFINRFTGEIHQLLFRKYGLISAHAYKDGFSPDVLIEYYNVFDAYPGRALTYLRTAQDFEVPRIPQSAPSYLFEESRMLRRPQGLRAAIEQFDPVWERDMKAEALTELAIRSHSSTAAEDLYLLNRGALHQAGIPLPVNLAIAGTVPRLEQSIQKVLSAQGIQPVTAEACRFQMFIRIDERSTGFRVQCELFDTMQGVSLLREEIPLVDFSRTELRQFALLLSATVFQNR